MAVGGGGDGGGAVVTERRPSKVHTRTAESMAPDSTEVLR